MCPRWPLSFSSTLVYDFTWLAHYFQLKLLSKNVLISIYVHIFLFSQSFFSSTMIHTIKHLSFTHKIVVAITNLSLTPGNFTTATKNFRCWIDIQQGINNIKAFIVAQAPGRMPTCICQNRVHKPRCTLDRACRRLCTRPAQCRSYRHMG